ncbi:hypothetical protein [Enterococcus sp. N249-2]
MANKRQRKKSTKNSTNLSSQAVSRKSDYYDKYSKTPTDYKSNLKGTVAALSSVTPESIQNLFQNPESNYTTIASYMDALYKKNGIVGRTLNYLLSHPTYNHSLYYELNEKNVNSKKDLSEYISAANYLELYNIYFYAPYFVKQTLINGMSFFYENVDKTGVSYFEFPISFGRIHSIENGVYRWMIDITKIKDDILPIMPKEIVNAYETTDRKDPKKWVDNKYYVLSNKGVAFCFDYGVIKNGGIAISEFAPLLTDSILVEKAKENVQIKDDIDAVRIIHAKIPTDKDGKPAIEADQAAKWDSALKRNLPSGIVGITNPFELDNITLNGSGNSKAYSTVSDTQTQLFYSTGTSSALFGSDTTSSNIVKLSVAKDASWLYTKVLPLLQNYYNYAMSNFKSKDKTVWKIKFIRQNNYTLSDDIKLAKDEITIGGSRLDYLAATGKTPLEAFSKLYMEQSMLDIDSIMIPKQTSFTLSSSEQSEGAGRPKTDNPTDDTDRISDAS